MQNVVERVLNLLIYLLESPTPVTAEDVRHTVLGYDAQTDEAFHRMFERDKDVCEGSACLSAAGLWTPGRLTTATRSTRTSTPSLILVSPKRSGWRCR